MVRSPDGDTHGAAGRSTWRSAPERHFGIAPLRADILNRIVGVTFDEAIASAESIEVDGRRIPVLGLDALLRAKRAAGRPKDLLDVTELERRRSKT